MTNITPLKTGTADMHKRIVLVGYSIRSYTAQKVDRKVSDETADAHKADEDAGRYVKHLIGRSDTELKAVQKVVGRARNTHLALTLKWSTDSGRLIGSRGLAAYLDTMGKLRSEFEGAVRDFLKAYPDKVQAAQLRLGDMFNEDDFPTVASIRNKFQFDINVLPVPKSGDFVVDLPKSQKDAIKQQIDDGAAAMYATAVDDLNTKIGDVLGHFASKLSDYKVTKAGDKKGVFRDSTVEKVVELARMLPGLNVTGDKRIDQLATRIEKQLGQYDADTLRADPKLRKDTAVSARKIISDVTDLFAA